MSVMETHKVIHRDGGGASLAVHAYNEGWANLVVIENGLDNTVSFASPDELRAAAKALKAAARGMAS